MGELQQLHLGVDPGALDTGSDPGRTDFQAPVIGTDVEKRGHPHRPPVRSFDRPRHDLTSPVLGQTVLDLRAHRFRGRQAGVPNFVEVLLSDRLGQFPGVLWRKRLERGHSAGERGDRQEVHAARLLNASTAPHAPPRCP